MKQPNCQKSTDMPYGFRNTISGARYALVPHTVDVRTASSPVPRILLRPMSAKHRCPFASTRMFSGCFVIVERADGERMPKKKHEREGLKRYSG